MAFLKSKAVILRPASANRCRFGEVHFQIPLNILSPVLRLPQYRVSDIGGGGRGFVLPQSSFWMDTKYF